MHIVVVGAGMAGLTAARSLHHDGHRVTVVDKGRSVGGRLATRRLGGATLDHGAQFFTVRSTEFQDLVIDMLDAGVVREWCRGFAASDGHPRYAAVGGMSYMAKWLARDLRCRTGALAFAVSPAESGWRVTLDDGSTLDADAVIVTCPIPQAFALLVNSGVELPDALVTIDYDRTLALLVHLDRPGNVGDPGGLQQPGEPFEFVADNAAKGVSALPALTLHATAAWSLAHWDDDLLAIGAQLREAAAPYLGSACVVEQQVKKWRFATPRTLWPDPCWVGGISSPLALAGDAFAGPRIEGAFLSGLAAAAAVSR